MQNLKTKLGILQTYKDANGKKTRARTHPPTIMPHQHGNQP
jgi:hypothetical protein